MLESTLISAEEPLSKSRNIASGEYCDNNIFFAENNDSREQILWNVNKNRIDFYKYENNCQNQLLNCFNFEEIYNDPTLVISFVTRCVDRFQESHYSPHSFKVIVTLNSGDGSSVVIVDIIAGCVLSTIAFPYTICSVEIVSGGKESNFNRPFGEAIQPLDGILAVGTVGGNVFLLDLRLDSLPEDPLISTQVTFSNIHKATIKDVTFKRAAAVQHQQNLAFMMNSFAKTKNHFVYTHADKKNVYNRFAAQNVYVSCLYYIPTNCSLAIGFNFGGLQMISLQQGFQLELSHELKSELPVIGFSHQLPESDPKNFIYFWVIRGMHQKSLGMETHGQCSLCTRAYLFRALYDKRMDTNFGISYSKFIQYEMVFYLPLVYNIRDQESKSITSSKLLEIFSVSKYSAVDGLQSVDNRYMVILWTAEASNHSNNRETHFVIFDLNQWYLYFDFKCKDLTTSAFLTVYSLRSVNGLISNQDRIQAMNFQTDSIRKFLFKKFNPLETDNVNNSPSSLSFNVMISSQEKLFHVKFLSIQKRALNEVYNKSTNVLSKPAEGVLKLSRCGIISQEALASASSSSMSHLDILFNMALNYSQMSFFRKIIINDDNASDVLDWLTREIIQTKKNIDDNSMSLFDYSGSSFSPEQQRILNSCECNLRYMMIILKFFEQLKYKQPNYLDIFHEKVKALNEVIELMHSFLKIIHNLHHVSILPERLPQNCYSGQTYYDYDIMRLSYENERKNNVSLCASAFPDLNKVLLIDLIVQYFEDSIKDAWKLDDDIPCDDSMSVSDPLYPPKNLHCLCRTFLLENETIPKLFREFILIYFLIDYCRMNHSGQEYLNTILPFFRSNNMDCKMQDLVLGIWHADHGNYDIALSFLCSSNTLKAFKDFRSIQTELFNELLSRIVELFIFHDRTKQALNFMEISEIFSYDTITESLYIYLLVCDQKLLSAVDFQRRRRSDETSTELFEKLLEFCNQKKCLRKLCFIELDELEEMLFLTYLFECEQQSKRLLLIFYYLSKNMFVEALNFVQNNQVDFSDEPQLLELLKSYENIVPLGELNTIARGMELLQTKYNHDAQDGMKFDVNQPVMKIYPKKSSRMIFTKSATIEQALIAKDLVDRQMRDPIKNFNSSVRLSSPMTPINSRKSINITSRSSSMMKAKVKFSSKKKKNPFAALLQTPDVKRQILADLSTQSISRPPSVLKRFVNDSESVHSTDSSRLKVNVKFKLPKLTVVSPVQENSPSVKFNEHSSMERSMELDDVETNETIPSMNSSSESLPKGTPNTSREFELRETPPLQVLAEMEKKLLAEGFSSNIASSTPPKSSSKSLLSEEPFVVPEKKETKTIVSKRTKAPEELAPALVQVPDNSRSSQRLRERGKSAERSSVERTVAPKKARSPSRATKPPVEKAKSPSRATREKSKSPTRAVPKTPSKAETKIPSRAKSPLRATREKSKSPTRAVPKTPTKAISKSPSRMKRSETEKDEAVPEEIPAKRIRRSPARLTADLEESPVKVKRAKSPAKSMAALEESPVKIKRAKSPAKSKAALEESPVKVKRAKSPAKSMAPVEESPVKMKRAKSPAKSKATLEESPVKVKRAKSPAKSIATIEESPVKIKRAKSPAKSKAALEESPVKVEKTSARTRAKSVEKAPKPEKTPRKKKTTPDEKLEEKDEEAVAVAEAEEKAAKKLKIVRKRRTASST